MKKILILPLLFMTFAIYADDDDLVIKNQMLDTEIEKLTALRDAKYIALMECEKKTEGFKVAGITTLAATGVGIYGNIKLAEKIHGKTYIGRTKGFVTDTRSEEQIAKDDCVQFCKDFPGEAAAICQC